MYIYVIIEYVGGASMYIKKYLNKAKTDSQIYLFISVPGSKKRKIVEKYPSLNKLIEEHGSEEKAMKFLKERCTKLDNLEKSKRLGKTNLEIDLNKKIVLDSDEYVGIKNMGYLFLQKAYYDLGIESFLNKWKYENKEKIKYSLNDAFRLLVYSRVHEPCSKLAVSRKTNDFIEDFDLSIDDLYDCLDRTYSFSKDLTRKLSNKCKSLIGGKGCAIYYDCTNFYFEIQEADDEKGLRDYGVEKNHRPDPIVEYGLLMDEDGFPIGSSTFRGNESEKTSLVPLLKEAGEDASKAKIIVADNGLNTEDNKKIIHDTGRNYIFCQSPKQLSEANLKEAFEDKNWLVYDNGKKKIKSYWIIRSNKREERLIVKFDKASYDFVNHTIDKRVERATKLINNPSKLNFSNCTDGKQYIRKLVVDSKTGEILKDKSLLELKTEEIENDRKYAGYMFYVTDIPRKKDDEDGFFTKLKKDGYRVEFMDDIEVAKIAGKRNDIEDCFRKMKTGMDARPIFVRKPEHIEAHLFTVYVALTLLMYIQKKYVSKMTTDDLLEAIRNYELCMLKKQTDIYKTGYYSKNVEILAKSMNFENMDKCYLGWNTIKEIISMSKNR